MSMTKYAALQPIRILHAVTRMDRGGIETFLMRTYRAIDRSRIQFDFLTHKPGQGAYDREILALGGRIFPIYFSYNPLRLFRYMLQLKSFFKTHSEYQVVHAHMNVFNGVLLSVARSENVFYRIAHIHAQSSGSPYREPVWNLVKLAGRNSFSLRFASSERAGIWAYGTKKNFTVIDNGIPLKLFYFDECSRKCIRNNYFLTGRLVIGHVGAFRPGKNQIFLIDVLAEVLKHNNNAVLLLVGAGHEQERVRNYAANLGLTQHVVFSGISSEPEKLYSAMDIFTLPSIKEGLGIAAIEAQASGLPTILSTGVPIEAVATDLAVRLPLNEHMSVAKWADEILIKSKLIKDRRSTKVGLEKFDITRTAKQLENIYLTAYAMQKEM